MRVAIIGGGISGLTAAYELEKARKAGRPIDWHLYDAANRLGGIIQTLRKDGFIMEGGPDGWVTEKPAARELAIELGLESHLLASRDETRKTYILLEGKLVAIPDHMRMMVPEDLDALEHSSLFSESAKQAYAAEPSRAEELRAAAPANDESIASFVQRHFGREVLERIAAPLLGGVFGGDVYKLSVRAVVPQFVAMEREYGSLITALQSKPKKQNKAFIFTSLRGGMQTLVDALVSSLPAERIHLHSRMDSIPQDVDTVVVATSLDGLRSLMPSIADHLPREASSAVLASLAWKDVSFQVPEGFGFLVPSGNLLAATFVDQKWPERVPVGSKMLRAFFGGESAQRLMFASDKYVVEEAKRELEKVLGRLPEADLWQVSRLPRSLPQYEVGHLEKVEKIREILKKTPHIHVLGNMLCGVGLPDLIGQARRIAGEIVEHASPCMELF